MFEITTNLRTFALEAPTVVDAVQTALILIVDGEEIVGCIFAGPFPYLITEIAA
jgi:hypothetical protein